MALIASHIATHEKFNSVRKLFQLTNIRNCNRMFLSENRKMIMPRRFSKAHFSSIRLSPLCIGRIFSASTEGGGTAT